MIKELFKDLAKYLPAMIVPAIVGIVALPIITRLFPPEEYGNYILVTATISVFSIIAVAWLRSSVARFFPIYKRTNEVERFYSIYLKLTLISIGAICVIFLIILFFAQTRISAELYSLMCIGALLLIATCFSSVLLGLLRAKRQVLWHTSFSIWQSVVGIGLGIALVIIFHFGVDGLLWGALISITAILPLMWKVSLGRPSLAEGSVRSSMTWEVVKYGIPAMGINLLTWALSLSDLYILEFFRGSQEVGIYSVSYGISEKTMFLITSLFLLPSVPIAYSIWEKEGATASQRFVHKLTRYYLLIGMPAAIGLSVLAKPIADVMFAPEYLLGYRIIPLVALGTLLVGFAHRFSLGLGYYKRSDLNMVCFLGAAVLNVGLNFAFIPKYGYVAAAVTTFASYAFLLLLEIVLSRQFFIWKFPFKSLAKVTCASAVMGAVVYPVGNSLTSSTLVNLVVGICIGVFIYTLMLLLLREPQKEEIRELQEIKNKILIRIQQLITNRK